MMTQALDLARQAFAAGDISQTALNAHERLTEILNAMGITEEQIIARYATTHNGERPSDLSGWSFGPALVVVMLELAIEAERADAYRRYGC
jgi:hypothetical protein